MPAKMTRSGYRVRQRAREESAPPAVGRPAVGTLVGQLVVAVAAAVAVQIWVQAMFRQVGHPVSLAAANLEPDAAVVRGWYRQLVDQETLLPMIRTELVDLLWPVCLGLAIVTLYRLVGTLVRRVHRPIGDGLFRWAPLAAVGPAFDLVENAFSLAMLTDPYGFPDWWALAHAGASWVKLAGSAAAAVVGLTLTIVAVLSAVVTARRGTAAAAGEKVHAPGDLPPR